MDRLSVTGSTPRTLLSRLQHYNQILISVAGKIQLYLHHVIVFSVCLNDLCLVDSKQSVYRCPS